MPGGRQAMPFDAGQADAICEAIMGGMSLDAALKLDGMPCRVTVVKWLTKYPEFAASYAHAREYQADKLADEIVHIADTELDPQVARNRIDARKWIAAKMRPRRYGDKVEIEHSGNVQGLGPVIIQITAHQPAAPVQIIECQAEKTAPLNVKSIPETTLTK